MKYAIVVGLAAAMTWLAGCASAPRVVVVEPVGPAPTGTSQAAGNGALAIFSARQAPDVDVHIAEWRWNNDFGRNEFAQAGACSEYVISSANGEVIKHVRNARTPLDREPTLVTLPAGSYRVEAEAVDCRGATVKVEFVAVVKAGETTAAHLDKRWSPLPPYNEADVAKLPCGKAIGWRAADGGLASTQ